MSVSDAKGKKKQQKKTASLPSFPPWIRVPVAEKQRPKCNLLILHSHTPSQTKPQRFTVISVRDLLIVANRGIGRSHGKGANLIRLVVPHGEGKRLRQVTRGQLSRVIVRRAAARCAVVGDWDLNQNKDTFFLKTNIFTPCDSKAKGKSASEEKRELSRRRLLRKTWEL